MRPVQMPDTDYRTCKCCIVKRINDYENSITLSLQKSVSHLYDACKGLKLAVGVWERDRDEGDKNRRMIQADDCYIDPLLINHAVIPYSGRHFSASWIGYQSGHCTSNRRPPPYSLAVTLVTLCLTVTTRLTVI